MLFFNALSLEQADSLEGEATFEKPNILEVSRFFTLVRAIRKLYRTHFSSKPRATG